MKTPKLEKNHDRCLMTTREYDMWKFVQHIDYPPMPFDPKYIHTLQSKNLTQTSQHSITRV